ncbi:hypothetical protein [Staphylococcus kloosii]|jgi:hypothetical protein|uniref:Yip1 domain-containing protein n=1 Tax=Staphylococcus kloosii TaxID=29384 RepID=A0A151A7H5_9STAP|nr:hypothetical protein [Staphylococcus kloosii]AVQ36995.1 hypothetical protein C7J89_12750 [Staphylococcus kloosii]KYH15287.1 hypothetical protein A0131_10980 [Staphylococcus kloosii]PNZ02128.1 hypothetical protein CD136_12830 [Staphylococcus kloosii]SUM50101.1 Uncharacterised protein [Staphylococcus kloosii]GEP82795.1 hypothetical protein SKL01_19730 [Staphylococcus kloosii]
MKTIKILSLYIISMIPYLASSLLLFFAFTYSDPTITSQVNSIKDTLSMTDNQLYFFIGLIVLIFNVLIFFFTFFVLKLIVSLFDRDRKAKDKDLFFSLLIGYTIANLATLIINDFFNVSFNTLSYIIPIVDLVIFIVLYYLFSKLKSITIVLFIIKLIIIVIGFFIK